MKNFITFSHNFRHSGTRALEGWRKPVLINFQILYQVMLVARTADP